MDFVVNWLASMPIFTVPLILAAVGLIINERAGVLNLGAEGILLCGSLAGAVAYLELGDSVALGLIGSVFAGVIVSSLFAILVVIFRTNQVVTGITLVFFGSGLTGLIGTPWTDIAFRGITQIQIPWLSDIPIIGKIFLNQDPMVYVSIVLIYLIWRFLYRSNHGLKLRAVGENPQAADANGVNVEAYRFFSVIIGGGMVGLAGGYLALASAKIFVYDMTQGRGWIAIALVIFARWRPWRVVLGGVLFGSIEALIPRVMAAGFPIPQYFLQMTPYLATLIVLIYAAVRETGGQDAPTALGTPYVRQDRR
tara:strand:+ start:72420 stop:73346 length:927 start_codon:yes stop_codon:yes gene_type:complete